MKKWLLLASLLLPLCLGAQKKELEYSAFDAWKRIDGTKLTPDGAFLSYEILSQEGDGTLVVRRAIEPMRKRGKAQLNREIAIPRGTGISVSPDGYFAYFRIKAPFAATRKAKIAKKKKEDMPKDSLGILDLKTFTVKKLPSLNSFTTGHDAKPYVAYKTSYKKGKKAFEAMVVTDPVTLAADTLLHVEHYLFSRDGQMMAYTTKKDAKDTLSKNAVILYNPGSREKTIISEGKKFYGNPVFSEAGDKLMVLASIDSAKSGDKHCSLLLFEGGGTREIIPQGYSEGLPEGWTVNQNASPLFTPDGNRIILGVAPCLPPNDTSLVDFEKAGLDIWVHDMQITPPQAKLQANGIKSKTYRSIIHLNRTPLRIIPLTTSYFEGIALPDCGMGTWALAQDDTRYRIASTWDDNHKRDIALVNLLDGSRRKVVEGLNGGVQLSPEGRFLIWYDFEDSHFYTYEIATGTIRNITREAGVNFWQEDDDHPSKKAPYDYTPRWVKGEEAVVLTDRYDLWKFSPTGAFAPVNLTNGYGRKHHVQMRTMDPVDHYLSGTERSLDRRTNLYGPDEQVMLTAFDDQTMKTGLAYSGLQNAADPAIVLDTMTFEGIVRARDNARILFFRKGNYHHCYDQWDACGGIASATRISDINPQQAQYKWGNVQLVEWKAYDGTPLKGKLYIPEDIAPGNKLPMMVYFYEKDSRSLYGYFPPVFSRSIINITTYCSRGYVVFVPDIVYKDGHPGQSAYNCICSGAEAMCEQFPFIDRSRMAIQGQSWGGYQVAWLVTRTDMFCCAGSGAPVSNMTSAYGGIRWGSGNVRSVQYEHGQSRIGKSMWEPGGLDLYIENSPLFAADKVNTPLLIMHNDADGAVPWYQGIEYFSALRRLGKPVWMLQYNGEAHNLVHRRNTRDLTRRLQQFFDYYMKGGPLPAWMKTGIPVSRKGEYFGFENAE